MLDDTLKPAWWGESLPLLSSSEMHLTLLRRQKANTAGKTRVGSCGKKGADGAWVHVRFHQHVPHQRAASPSPWHSKHGACGSATVGRAAARYAQPVGCVGLMTALETIAGPSLQWYKIVRNKQYQNWRSFSLHLWLNQFWESMDIKVALTFRAASVCAAPGSDAGDKLAAILPLPSPEF